MTFSEFEFIKRIRKQNSGGGRGLVAGIGDDCAVYRSGEYAAGGQGKVSLVTSDALVESIHFDLSWHPAKLLGRKSLSVNISDIAAMGGRPLFALLTIGFSGQGSAGLIDEFMAGFREVLAEHRMALIGGDTVRSSNFFISVTVIGEGREDRILFRSGAKEGDDVWVSGFLGHAAAGLEICRRGITGGPELEVLKEAHLDPVPLVSLGEVLGASGLVSSMMDVSDGVATDLSHLCAESSVGAEVEEEMVPLSAEIIAAAGGLHCSPLDWALRGGEDYQLLFTSSSANRSQLKAKAKREAGAEIFRIGRVVKGQGVKLCGHGRKKDVSYGGFDHFLVS